MNLCDVQSFLLYASKSEARMLPSTMGIVAKKDGATFDERTKAMRMVSSALGRGGLSAWSQSEAMLAFYHFSLGQPGFFSLNPFCGCTVGGYYHSIAFSQQRLPLWCYYGLSFAMACEIRGGPVLSVVEIVAEMVTAQSSLALASKKFFRFR